jgi:DNA recombination protein RmuC
MDTILIMIGDWPITYGAAALAGFGILMLLLLVLIIIVVRSGSQKTDAAAQAASEGLRANFVQQIAERDGRLREAETELGRQRQLNTNLTAERSALQTRLEEQARQAERMRLQMTNEFKVIANEILTTNSEKFTKQNKEQVDALLAPLREKIGEFQKGLVDDRATMGERIKILSEESMRMATEANNLTRALKGSSQTQGAWGEMILSTILERSGLREGEQFVTQQSHTGDDGIRLRTDVEVMMPNGDSIVIDSKVSLNAFEAFTNTDDTNERDRHLAAHIASIRAHVKTLSGKDYQRHARSGMDFVLMFMPIEAAFSVAITEDPLLIDFATSHGVFINTPTTLMSVLRTVRNVWDIEKRHQNAEQIAERAGGLYDKVAGFLGTMDKLDRSLNGARSNFDEAKAQLSSGRGNVLRQVEMLRELGAKSGKVLPPGWEPDAGEGAVKALSDASETDGIGEEPERY